jgi:hypothetical protein
MLARFRFPTQQPLELPVQPLQQIAARAAFDDLGASITRATARLRPSLLVVARAPAAEVARSVSVEDLLRHRVTDPLVDYVLALRFQRDLALVVSSGRPLVLSAADARRLEVRGRDDLNGLTILRLRAAGEDWQPLGTARTSGPQYMLVAEPVAGEIAMRPLFGGPAGQLASPHWDGSLVALGQQVQAAPGALVFALDGSLVGAVVRAGDGTAIVPADVLLAAATRVASAPPRVPGTIGVHLQALDVSLAAATGAEYGVAVSGVDPRGPADGVLRAGDVITAVADRPVGTPETALLALAALDVGKPAVLQVMRAGRLTPVSITPRALAIGKAVESNGTLGLSLRRSSRGAVVLDVERSSAAERAGLVTGDVIASVSGTAGVTPASVARAYSALAPGAHVVLGIERNGAPLLVALTRPRPAT